MRHGSVSVFGLMQQRCVCSAMAWIIFEDGGVVQPLFFIKEAKAQHIGNTDQFFSWRSASVLLITRLDDIQGGRRPTCFERIVQNTGVLFGFSFCRVCWKKNQNGVKLIQIKTPAGTPFLPLILSRLDEGQNVQLFGTELKKMPEMELESGHLRNTW